MIQMTRLVWSIAAEQFVYIVTDEHDTIVALFRVKYYNSCPL